MARAEGSFAKSFAGKIGGEAAVVDSCDRQAAAVHGDAVCDGQRRAKGRRMNGDSAAVAVEVERLNRAEMFDDAGEHVARAPSAIECTAFRDGA